MKSKIKRKWLKFLLIFGILIGCIWLYTSSLIGVKRQSIDYMEELVTELKAQDYIPNFYVVSGKRWKWHNDFLSRFGGAASQSRHLRGEAIDILVLDVNKDGKSNSKDVDIVYNILNTKIIGNKGGIGTYKKEQNFFSRQMVHFDCRGHRARWHR